MKSKPIESLGKQRAEAVSSRLVHPIISACDPGPAREGERRAESLAAVLADASIALWVMDCRGVVRHSQGREFSRIWGLSADEIVGRSAFDLGGSDPEFCDGLKRVLSGCESRAWLKVHGRTFECRFEPIWGDDGAALEGAIGIAFDMTERIRGGEGARQSCEELEARLARRTNDLRRTNQELLEQIADCQRLSAALKRSEETWQSLIENSPDCILIVAHDGVIQYANRSLPRFPILAAPEANLFARLPTDWSERVRDAFRAAIETRQQTSCELDTLGLEGESLWYSARFVPVSHDGQVATVVMILADRTRQKLAEEAVRKKQEELAHICRVATMGEMVSALAHELNQPLAAIANYSHGCMRRLNSDTTSTQDLLHALEEVVAQAQRASHLIRRLRRFFQKREPQPAPASLNELVQEAVALVAPEARRQKVRVRLEMADELPTVQVDTVPLQHVLLNLCLNGIEAMQQTESGQRELVIRTELMSERAAQVVVRDRGCGLKPGYQDTIFEPFHTTKENGLGMGLSISRSIVEAHGGRLWADPNEDGGATFRFSLPIRGGGANEH